MTATPRQLSDAIQADYDDIVASRTAESATISRWALTRSISGWVALGISLTVLGALSLSVLLGSIAGFVLSLLLVVAAPLMLVPALVVWTIAAVTGSRLEAKRNATIFTLYGITIDRTVSPPVYSVNVPASWTNPELRRTRALLNATTDADEDAVVTAEEK